MKKRLLDYDAMKVIAILLVVLAHATRMYSPDGVVKIVTQSGLLTDVTNFIYLFHMPAFLSISGAIYYFMKREKGKYTDKKAYTNNKAIRLLIPYFAFVLFYNLPTLLIVGVEDNIIMYIIKNIFLLGGPNHLWYAVMIFNIFILFNFFESKIYNANPIIVFILLVFVSTFSFIIPNLFQISKTFYYLLFFFTGYIFQKNKSKMHMIITRYISLMLMIIILIIGFIIIYKSEIALPFLIERIFRILLGLDGTVLLYGVSYYLSNVGLMKYKVFQIISNDSFGIYLFHPMIIYLLFYFTNNLKHNPFIGTFLIFIISTVLSILLINIFRFLNINFLIGEKASPKKKILIKSVEKTS